MSIPMKSILTVTGTDGSQEHVGNAISVAQSLGAHLTIVVVEITTPSVVNQYAMADAINRGATYEHGIKAVEHRAKDIEAQVKASGFTAQIITACVLSVEVDNLIASYALFADLTVLPLNLPITSSLYRHACYGALFHAGSPVLLLPKEGTSYPASEHTVVAWDSGVQSARAIRQAVLGLTQAKQVTSVSIDARPEHGGLDERLIRYLNSYQVTSSVRSFDSGSDSTGQALLGAAAELNADMLVMGAYGHSRLREFIVGGTTRYVIEHAKIPVFLMH